MSAAVWTSCVACEKAQADFFYSFCEQGVEKKFPLCRSCAEAFGAYDETCYDLRQKLEAAGVAPLSEPITMKDESSCPSCGFTQSDFKRTGRFGCAHCYGVFDEGLESLLDAMHGHTQHQGKSPQSFEADQASEPQRAPTEGIQELELFEEIQEEELESLELSEEIAGLVEEVTEEAKEIAKAQGIDLDDESGLNLLFDPDMTSGEPAETAEDLSLEEQLNKAILEERYEDAAKLRDLIDNKSD